MAYSKAHFDIASPSGQSRFHEDLALKNIGVSLHVLLRGQGFDFFHNHREQEEVYLCLSGSADLKIGGETPETVRLEAGDIVRVDPGTLRAIGNESSDRALLLIAGGCPHPYPAGVASHDVIADVLAITGQGETGFTLPPHVGQGSSDIDDDC